METRRYGLITGEGENGFCFVCITTTNIWDTLDLGSASNARTLTLSHTHSLSFL